MGNTPQDDVLAAAAALIGAIDALAKEPAFSQGGFDEPFDEWTSQITLALPPNAPLPESASTCANAVAAFNAAQAGLAGAIPTDDWSDDELSLILQALVALDGDDKLAAKKRPRKARAAGPKQSSRT